MTARAQEPSGTRVMDDSPPEELVHEWTLPEVASQLGVYRQTLLRMEQRKFIPPARWRRKPTPHRVYNAIEIEAIKAIIDAAKAEVEVGRNYVEDEHDTPQPS